MKKSLLVVLIVAILSSAAVAERISVGTSIYPLYDWVRVIGGDRVDAFCLLEPGASPHTFAPRPRDVARISGARLFFVVGRGLEPWVEKLVKAAKSEIEVVRLGEGMDEKLKALGYPDELVSDPHIWLDPLAAKMMVARIADELCRIDADGCKLYRSNLANYSKVLDDLAAEMRALGERFAGKKVVIYHGAFRHFLFRCGIGLLGVVEEFPGQEPSSLHLKKLMDAMKREGVSVVFVEPQHSAREARIIASEIGGTYEVLDPLGGVPGRDTYEKLIRFNLRQLEKVFKGDR